MATYLGLLLTRNKEVKVPVCNAEDLGSIPGLERSSGEGNGNPLQYSCLENPIEGGAWWATDHEVTRSRTQLSYFTSSLARNKEITGIIIK